MKTTTQFLIVFFLTVSLFGYSQTTISVGADWDNDNGLIVAGTHSLPAISDRSSYVLGSGDTEIAIKSSNNTKAASEVYALGSTALQYLDPTGGEYVEYSLTVNSATKNISYVRVNGSYNTKQNTCAILFSDNIPFDEDRVIGYAEAIEFDKTSDGAFAGFEIAAPEGCKSYRLYKVNKSGQINLFLTKTSPEGEPDLYEVTVSKDVPGTYDKRITGADSGNRIKAAFLSATLVDDESPVSTSTLTVNQPENGGVILISPEVEDNIYLTGSSVTLTAHPYFGYEFSAWTGDDSGDVDEGGVLVMNDDKAISANFDSFIKDDLSLVDIGIDWNGSAVIETATYGMEDLSGSADYTALNLVIGEGDSQINIKSGTKTRYRSKEQNYTYAPVAASVECAYFEVIFDDGNEGFVEYSLPAITTKNITQIKINGVSSSTGGVVGLNVLYSDVASFDESSVIGYVSADACKLAALGVGDLGFTDSSVPAGTKSFRIYKHSKNKYLYLKEIGDKYIVSDSEDYTVSLRGPDSNSARITYIGAILQEENQGPATANPAVNASKKTLQSQGFYDITGKEVGKDFRGLTIIKSTYVDGTVITQKRFIQP